MIKWTLISVRVRTLSHSLPATPPLATTLTFDHASANHPGPLSTCRVFQASITISIVKEAISKDSIVFCTTVEALNDIFIS